VKSNKTLSHEVGFIFELPQDVDVITCIVKTCQDILWLCKHHQKGQHPKT